MFIFVNVQNMCFFPRTHDPCSRTTKTNNLILYIFTIFSCVLTEFDNMYEKETENL